jgi:hypothetical protein
MSEAIAQRLSKNLGCINDKDVLKPEATEQSLFKDLNTGSP